MVVAPNQCSFQCLDGFEGDYDGVPLGPVSTTFYLDVEYGYGYYYGDTVDAFYDWVSATSIGGIYSYGPTYTLQQDASKCAQSEVAGVTNALHQLAQFIVASGFNVAKYGVTTRVVSSAWAAINGGISWEAFCDVLLSAFTLAALTELIADAAVAVSIALLVDFLWCTFMG